jgi:HTH-type transcriptional regulator/antitoxin HipB
MSIRLQVPDQLGANLRTVRLQRGLTQADVARQLGVSVQAVSRLEQHAGRASFDRIHRLCLLLGLDIVLQPKDLPGRAATAATEW